MNLSALSLTSFSHASIDWIIVVVLVLLITVDAMRSGSGRAAVIATAFPISVFVFNLIPHTFLLANFASSLSTPVLQAALFASTFVVFFILLYRMIYTFGGFSSGLFYSILSGLSATAVLIAMWIQEPALQNIWHFGPQITSLFGGTYTLLWLFGAYIILAFVRS